MHIHALHHIDVEPVALDMRFGRRNLLRRAEACDDFLLGLTILYAVENQLVVIIRHLTLLHRAKLRQSRHQLVEKRFSVHTSSPLINA